MPLLTVNNPKTLKGQTRGYLTAILHLAPAETAQIRLPSGGLFTVCPNAGNCKGPCLNTAGRGGLGSLQTNTVQKARRARTRLFFHDRPQFFLNLAKELGSHLRAAERSWLTPAFRPNGTSDLPVIAETMSRAFPLLQMYDYTKLPRPWERRTERYHLTYSWDGPRSWSQCEKALAHDINVAVPFRVCDHGATCSCPLPAAWRGVPVINGDEHDLRFLDPTGVIVGLRAKGRARRQEAIQSGFTVDVRNSKGATAW